METSKSYDFFIKSLPVFERTPVFNKEFVKIVLQNLDITLEKDDVKGFCMYYKDLEKYLYAL